MKKLDLILGIIGFGLLLWFALSTIEIISLNLTDNPTYSNFNMWLVFQRL